MQQVSEGSPIEIRSTHPHVGFRHPVLGASKRTLLIATARSLNGAYNVGQLAKQGKLRSLMENVCERDFNAFGLANIRLGQADLTVTD